jgi:hypothetical protein
MREVVVDLRSENAEALLELYEFEYAMIEVRRNLEGLVSALRELEPSVAKLADANVSRDAARHVVEHATFVTQRAEQIAGAFREFCRGMTGWGITDAN